MSYWARTVLVPLLVLRRCKPRARNPRGIGIDELFVDAARAGARLAQAARIRSAAGRRSSAASTACCSVVEPLFPRSHAPARHRQRACAFVTERLNGEDGLGAIYPGHGQRRDDVSTRWAIRRTIRDRAIARALDREAAGGPGGRGLLPALRLAGLGHGAGRATP